MKKLYFIMTLIFMSLMASCSQEEIVNRETENKRVSISAEFPGNIASTRASISIPATHKLRCIIEVWEAEKNPELKYRNEMTVEGGVVVPTFDFALKPGEYNCLIWADLIKKDAATSEVTIGNEVTYTHFEDTYYDTSDLNSVKVKDAKALFDTDLCDGFFMSMQLKKSDTPVQKVVKLVRPFAKLIVKENEAEKFATLQKISVSYEMPEAFNVATGEPTAEKVSGLYEKTFTSGDVSRILFTSYRFVPSTETTVSSSTLSFKTAAGTIRCEIPGDVITLKRNQQMTAGGNLISGGGIEPEPEPEPSGEDPQIGDYFFIDGTWSSELTEVNKDKCVGIVYAVGAQQGDKIDDYGESVRGKSIKGYVMALKDADVAEFLPSAADGYEYVMSGRPYFYRQKDKDWDREAVEAVKKKFGEFTSSCWDRYNGFSLTKALLQIVSDDETCFCPALTGFAKWKAKQKDIVNSSGWYIPSAAQQLHFSGRLFGFNGGTSGKTTVPAVEINQIYNQAFSVAIDLSIMKNFPGNNGGKGYYLHSVSLSNDPAPHVLQVGAGEQGKGFVGTSNPSFKLQASIRPVLTIIK